MSTLGRTSQWVLGARGAPESQWARSDTEQRWLRGHLGRRPGTLRSLRVSGCQRGQGQRLAYWALGLSEAVPTGRQGGQSRLTRNRPKFMGHLPKLGRQDLVLRQAGTHSLADRCPEAPPVPWAVWELAHWPSASRSGRRGCRAKGTLTPCILQGPQAPDIPKACPSQVEKAQLSSASPLHWCYAGNTLPLPLLILQV